MARTDAVIAQWTREHNLELARAVQATRREIVRRQQVRREARRLAIRAQLRLVGERAAQGRNGR